MYGMILLGVLVLVSPDLSLWYSHCSKGNWHNAAEEATSLVNADSSNTEVMSALLISGTFSGISEIDLLNIEASTPYDSLSPLLGRYRIGSDGKPIIFYGRGRECVS